MTAINAKDGEAVISWNYRVIVHPDDTVAIHEVFYDGGVPTSWGAEPAVVGFHEDVSGLSAELALLAQAAVTPPLYLHGDRLSVSDV